MQWYTAGWWAAAKGEPFDDDQNEAWKNGYEDFVDILGDTNGQETVL